MFKITHSAGHALTTPGKQSPDGYKEWSYTNEIVKLVMAELDKYEEVSQKRIDDPTGKTDFPLIARTNIVNSFNGQLHIDYHLNAFGNGWSTPGGTEVFVYKTSLKEAYALAQKVQTNLVKELGFANRGVKAGDLHMIRETKPTAILIEFAFMSNQNEAMKMRTAEYQKRAALAVVDGIVAQYGLKRKYAPVPQKEEIDMLEKAVVIFGEADYPTGKRLAARLGGAPVFARSDVTGKKVAKELYVVGGDTNGMVADKVVLLSGYDYFATVAAVKKFIG
jgi:N-acetylmuramoyl-L-alanine amidase